MIHRAGKSMIKKSVILLTLIVGLSFYILPIVWFYISFSLAIFLILFLIWFFRNPKREFIIDKEQIVAPVDGRVVIVEEVFEPEFLKTNCKQVSIFMSPFNVHVTRYPISGKVIYTKYHPGKYLVAYHPKSSIKNERTTVAVETSNSQKIVFRQIAGLLARRIVLYAKIGDEAKAGKEFGFIKFGSRLDLFLPLESKIVTQLGDKTIGGKTILGSIS